MRFPWEEADDVVAAVVEATGQPVPVAWWGRTSDEDQQDPTLSLPRQLRSCRDALPANYVLVAHFYDVESGRMNLDDRGKGHAHEAFDIPIPRDGGIQDLLAEAKRPDRRFVAVICESVERVARRTYYGARVEHELEQSGVMLLAADEPFTVPTAARQGRAPKRSTPILTRRVKQAIAEFQVLQMLELSWDGTAEHTEQGWNIGKPCYGYSAEKLPHPVAAKRAEGRTKSRLIPNPTEGPTVTRIFHLRAVNRYGYRTIADLLNADLDRHPPPTPVNPERALGRWSASAVRDVLVNPKYTGYMVWNRRATSSANGRVNPPSQWVWSLRPTHEPLVTKELFQAVAELGRFRQGSRPGSAPNTHPRAAGRTYLLRSYVYCSVCSRRMHGRISRGRPYYVCEPERHHHAERRNWYDGHPKALWVREDDLIDIAHGFFAEHVLGPRREAALRRPSTATPRTESPAVARLQAELADLDKRRQNVFSQIEEHEPTGDDDVDRDFRAQLRRRFADLTHQHKAKAEQLAGLLTTTPASIPDDPTVLDDVPVRAISLVDVPEERLRDLYDSFNLELRYEHEPRIVTVRVTVRQDRVPEIRAAIDRAATPGQNGKRQPVWPAAPMLVAPPTGFEPVSPP